MYASGVLSLDNPHGLLNRVFVELSLNFGRQGHEGLRSLCKQSIIFKYDDIGHEYASVCYNELDKNHQMLASKDGEKVQIK